MFKGPVRFCYTKRMRRKRKKRRQVLAGAPVLAFLAAAIAAQFQMGPFVSQAGSGGSSYETEPAAVYTEQADTAGTFDYDQIPEYAGSPSVTVNGNVPFFQDAAGSTDSYETFSDLDTLGRCGPAEACLGEDLMPVEPRGSIGMVKPSGWHTVKYDGIDGNYLYNRCHLIAFELSGENANPENLITGTRYMNVEGMLPYENETADFIRSTGFHVHYRVTPVFEGSDLVARGVLIEAESLEDGGAGLRFCVFCYNVQPGIAIDYSDGSSEGPEFTGG